MIRKVNSWNKKLAIFAEKTFGTDFKDAARVSRILSEFITRIILIALTACVAFTGLICTSIFEGFKKLSKCRAVKNMAMHVAAVAVIIGLFLFFFFAPVLVERADEAIFGYTMDEYTVRSGDTIWEIAGMKAEEAGISQQKYVQIVYDRNDLGKYIYAGDVIKVPVRK